MTPVRDGQHDFDFFHGKWTSVQRKLTRRLQNSDDWVEFRAELECFPILGDTGNAEFVHGTLPGGDELNGMSVRLYDPATDIWRIYWLAKGHSEIFPPVLGTFRDGVGIFEGEDVENGVPIKVVFEWTNITPTSATWSQRFSDDDGKTWETNWINVFTRVE
jgi:hypothetical protein